MATITTPEEIANLALDLLAQQDPIADIDGAGNAEVLISRWYDTTRRRLLRMYNWNFAKAQALLTASGTVTPAFGYDYAYEMPDDCVRVLFLGDIDSGTLIGRNLYAIFGKHIYVKSEGISTSDSSLPLTYTADEDDPALFDAMFTDLLSIELAVRISYKITLKPSALDRLGALLKSARSDAASTNGQEEPPIRVQTSRLIQNRRRMAGHSNIGGGIYYE